MNLLQKKVKVEGVEYTLQGLSARDYYKCMQQKDEKGNMDTLAIYDYFFDHVIVNPRVSFDDFDSSDFETIERLMGEVNTFLTTKPKNKVEGSSKK
jgi:hypothetical protein